MTEQLLETWASVVPDGVRFGKQLFDTGDLRRMRAEGLVFGDVFERLNEK